MPLGRRLTSLSFSSKKDAPFINEAPPPAYRETEDTTIVRQKDARFSSFAPQEKEDDSKARARLGELAEDARVNLSPELIRFPLLTEQPTYMEERDLQIAEEYIIERRAADPQYKAPSGFSKLTKSKAKQAAIDDKEINRALIASVQENAALSLVEALLVMGGSVDVSRKASKSIWKKMTRKDQSDRPSETLQNAIVGAELPMVQLLASRATKATLNEGLLVALKQDSVDKTKAVLEWGADASIYHDEVISLIEQDRETIVRTLFLGSNPPKLETANVGNIKAIERGSLPLCSFLLACGAQASCYNGKSLEIAIRSHRLDLLVALFGASCPPSGTQADNAVAIAYREGRELMEKTKYIEVCLIGGAIGQMTGDTLVTVIGQGEQDLVTLFLEYRVSVDHDNGSPVITAIKLEHTQILKFLLAARPSNLTLSLALITAAASSSKGVEYCTLLLDCGASVDFENGAAMCEAIEARSYETLKLLLSRSPSQPAMTIPFQRIFVVPGKERMKSLQLFLDAGLSQKDLDEALAAVVLDATPDEQVIKSLLTAGASPDFQSGVSVSSAACGFKLNVLQLLINSVVSKEYVLSKATTDVIASNDDWLGPDGLAVLQFLLENGADVATVYVALHRSASLFHEEACQFLATWVESEEEYTFAFGEAIAVEDWFVDETKTLGTLELLLEHSAKGELVDIALLQALDAIKRGLDAEAFVDLFLQYKADVDYQDGQSLQIAALTGNVTLLQKLFVNNPNRTSLSMAFSMAFVADHPAKTVMSIINAFFEKDGKKPDPKFVYPTLDPPIFLCLQNYSKATNLVKRVCELGCDLEAKIEFRVYGEREGLSNDDAAGDGFDDNDHESDDDPSGTQLIPYGDMTVRAVVPKKSEEAEIPAERITVLCWTCCQSEDAMPGSTISILIESKANINFATERSKSSPLILAARYERTDIITMLLRNEAKPSSKDVFDRSALFFAAGNGDVKSVKALIKHKARTNDGSLHEAARLLQAETIALLIKGNHNPNFSSTKHEGLTPLAELCMYCDSAEGATRIEESIEALKKGKLEVLKQWKGKSVLYMALDNQNPIPITSALIEQLMGPYIDKNENIYTDDLLSYSPTMYLKKGFFLGSPDIASELESLLKMHGAQDNYYAKIREEQPIDAVGLPKDILKYENERINREEKQAREDEDHYRELQRQAEEAWHKYNNRQMLHEQTMQHSQERFMQQQMHAAGAADLKYRIDSRANQQKLNYQSNSAAIAVQKQNYLNQAEAAKNRERIRTKQQLSHIGEKDRRQQRVHKAAVNHSDVQAARVKAQIKDSSAIRGLQVAANKRRITGR